MAKQKPLDPKEDRSPWHCHRCGLTMADKYPASDWFVKLKWNEAGYWECDRSVDKRADLCDENAKRKRSNKAAARGSKVQSIHPVSETGNDYSEP